MFLSAFDSPTNERCALSARIKPGIYEFTKFRRAGEVPLDPPRRARGGRAGVTHSVDGDFAVIIFYFIFLRKETTNINMLPSKSCRTVLHYTVKPVYNTLLLLLLLLPLPRGFLHYFQEFSSKPQIYTGNFPILIYEGYSDSERILSTGHPSYGRASYVC